MSTVWQLQDENPQWHGQIGITVSNMNAYVVLYIVQDDIQYMVSFESIP